MKLKQIICIVLVLMLSICLLTACSPKDDGTTNEDNSEINIGEYVDENAVDAFKDKYGDKLPWGNGSSGGTTSGGVQGT